MQDKQALALEIHRCLFLSKGSSKAMEGWGMVQLMKNLKSDEMGVSQFIVDGDSSSRKSIKVLSK